MKNPLKKQLKDSSYMADVNNEVIEYLNSDLKELNPLIKKLENEEEIDKEIVYDIFKKYKQLLQFHRQIYEAANNIILDENVIQKDDVMYGYG